MDEIQLIKRAKNGDTEALEHLMSDYKYLVNKIARNYFIIGAEYEDVIQEGMIGLFNAYSNFDENKNASFKTFASLLINRQIITAIKKAYKEKDLSFIEDLNIENLEHEFDVFDPEEFIIHKESHNILLKEISEKLSKMERKILLNFLKNYSYDEIAQSLNLSKKSVDNALTRIRKKLNYLI